MERFWGSLNNELVHHQRYATRAQAEAAILGNTSKSSYGTSRLGNLSPAVFAQNFSKRAAAA